MRSGLLIERAYLRRPDARSANFRISTSGDADRALSGAMRRLRQDLLPSPLERGVRGVARQDLAPLSGARVAMRQHAGTRYLSGVPPALR